MVMTTRTPPRSLQRIVATAQGAPRSLQRIVMTTRTPPRSPLGIRRTRVRAAGTLECGIDHRLRGSWEPFEWS